MTDQQPDTGHEAEEVSDERITGVASYLFEVGVLKHIKRTGWWIAGVKDPETIAEHSFRTSILATVLAALEGADPARAAQLAVFHDTQETRVGDIPHVGRRYLTAADNEAVTIDQVADCPPVVAGVLRDIVATYEAQDTPEALVAKDADRLECLIQALEYRRQGCAGVQEWIDSCRTGLKTTSAQRIADAALTLTGLEWQRTHA
ncbi:MAG: HD domain-containing protein [Actinobacteria bacterium]|nr:HD domain-containing protein [Actinomycetota bacterium]